MLKPEKVWRVGDEFFKTYAEAHAAAVQKRRGGLRQDLFDTFTKNINWEGFTGGDDDIYVGVDAVLAWFNVTRKKSVKPALKVVR